MKQLIKNIIQINLNNRCDMYHVTNENLIEKIKIVQFYEQMNKEFKELIDEELIISGESNISNKVWICWFQGEEKAPDLVKACINSVRRNMPQKEIIVLSEKNISDYICFPDYIQDKWEKGIIGPAHYSDLLRISLLCKYGGLWLDATVLCTSSSVPKYITEAPLFVFKQMDLTRKDIEPIIASNWLISSNLNSCILALTQKLLYNYWKNNEQVGNYFVFHVLFAIASRKYFDEWKDVPFFNNHSPHTLQFELNEQFSQERWEQIKTISCFHKLNHHVNFNTDGTFYQHILDEYL